MATKTKQVAKKKVGGLSVKRLRESLENKYQSDSFWTPVAGMNKIRLLPLPNDSEVFWVEVQEAYIPKPDGKSKQRFVSPKSGDLDAYCPVNAVSKALYQSGQKDLASELRPSSKYYCNAAVLNQSGKWEYKPVKLAYMVWRDLIEHCLEEAEELGIDDDGLIESSSLLDPKKGLTINIRRREVNNRVEYKTTISDKALPIEPGWLDLCQDFSKETISGPVADIEAALCEYLDVDDLSEIIGGAGVAKPKAKKASKRPPVEDDEDDDDDADDSKEEDEEDADPETDDDEEDEEDDDDDGSDDGEEEDPDAEDDEEEDDEDEDPAPVKRKPAVKAAPKRRRR